MSEIKTEFGVFTVYEPSWGNYVEYQTDKGDEVELFSPEWDEPEDFDIEIRTPRAYLGTDEEVESLIGLIRFTRQLAGLLREAVKGSAKEAEKIRQEREAEEERKREERLLMEFVGETVKIRERGYKTARVAEVEAYQPERYDFDKREYVKDEEYSLKFVYTGDQRTQQVSSVQRLDIKVGASWETLWDDGCDDIGGPEYLAGSAKPTGKMYDTRRQEGY